ncbi:MAG: ATP-binding protein [Candidatus Aenigmatarchaeota archaeon]
MIIGRCIGETSPTEVAFVSKTMPKVGEYVVLEYEDKKILGMIEALVRGSVSITEDIFDPDVVEKIKEIEGGEYYIRGTIKILGDIDNLKIPRTPPAPGTDVKKADPEVLKRIFGSGNVKIGNLITQEDVPVYLDANKIVNRHLSILALTGAGKSNAVAVLLNELLKYNGTILIFDMHSEYVNAKFCKEVNIIPTKISPIHLSNSEAAKLANITSDAYIQYRYFRMAYESAKKYFFESGATCSIEMFFEKMQKELDEYLTNEKYKKEKSNIVSVKNKIDDLLEYYKDILDLSSSDVIEQIKFGKINVVDLGLTDESGADVIVNHFLRKILESRKSFKRNENGLKTPIFVVLEEAHILAPAFRETLSKRYIARIAREGRKFGVGLCLVSQRPKALDVDALSQVNNMIILKLVEPTDQRHVQAASEALSDELLAHLPSLNVGEAVVLGPMIKVPALVKIDKFEGKLVGRDPDILKEWKEAVEEVEQRKKDALAFI